MFIIQIIPEIYQTEKIKFLFAVIHSFILSVHYKLRWACCYAITILSKNFPKDFQRRFHSGIAPIISQGLCDQNIGVINEACKACRFFIETCDKIIADEYLNNLTPLIIGHLISEKTSECALQTLEVFSHVYKTSMRNYFPEIFSLLKDKLIKSSNMRIKSSSIDCLLSIRKIIQRNEFHEYIPEYILILKSLSDPLFFSDSTKNALLNAWKLLCKYLKSEFTPYLQEIVPLILEYLSRSACQDTEEYLETLLSIIESIRGGYILYTEYTTQLILPLINSNISAEVRMLSASIGGALICAIKESGNNEYLLGIVQKARMFLAAIWKNCSDEKDLHVIIDLLGSIRIIIEAPGYEFLNTDEVHSMGEMILKLLQDKINSEYKEKEVKDQQDYLKTTISDILSALFKSHKGSSIAILDYVYTNVIGNFLNSNNSDNDKVFALIVIADIIECVGNILHPIKLKELSDVLSHFALSSIEKIRKAAIIGISVMIIHLSNENFLPFTENILSILDKAINSFDCKKKTAKKIRESAILAVGKLIKHQKNCLKLDIIIPWWIKYLPIIINKDSAKDAHDFLADLIINEANYMVESELLINIIMSIAYTENCSDRTIPKIAKILDMYIEVNDQKSLISCISPINRIKLSKLLLI